MPKVSVIIPTYNRSELLKEAVASVLRQSFDNIEVIVVDDGSTDDTSSVVKAIKDSRVRYFYKSNGGVSIARNFGLSKADSEYIAFLDSDDLWPENHLQIMIEKLQAKPDYGATYCITVLQLSDGSAIKSENPARCRSGRITKYLFQNSVIWPSASVLRKEMTGDISFDELLNDSEDSDFFLRLSMRIKFLFIPDIRITRRVSIDSLSLAAGISCNRILSLERFYFRLGGDKIIPARMAKRKISHACRKVAEVHRKAKNRSAAIQLYRYAIWYWPYDLRLYLDFLIDGSVTK